MSWSMDSEWRKLFSPTLFFNPSGKVYSLKYLKPETGKSWATLDTPSFFVYNIEEFMSIEGHMTF